MTIAHDSKDGWKPLTNVADWPAKPVEVFETAYGPAVRLSDVPDTAKDAIAFINAVLASVRDTSGLWQPENE